MEVRCPVYIKIHYINVKIPVLRLCRGHKRKSKIHLPLADSVSAGSVVVTRNAWDVGLVVKTRDGIPSEVYSRHTGFEADNTCPRYSITGVQWYDTGIHMTLREWIDLSRHYDAQGFHAYWESRLGIKD